MKRTRVAVLYGGRSVEREVSRVSARTIVASLDPSRYEVVSLAVGPDGRFLAPEESAKLLATGGVPERFRGGAGAGEALVPAEIAPGRIDVVFPIIHGTTGEDGALQGFLETLGVPYVGAGVTASAVGMDKAVFKALLRDAGLPTPRAVVVRSANEAPLAASLPLPVFVKPSNGGSSVGVTKVKRAADLAAAIAFALDYDERALVEEGIDARELERAVLGNEAPRASIPGEIVPDTVLRLRRQVPGRQGAVPDPGARLRGRRGGGERLAVAVFRLCGVSGMARVDFFLERGTDRVLINEINTLPGFTAISMYPKLWEASGVALPALLDELVRLALERHARRAGC